ncbi:MAG: AraC family transcriptional regulator, partial [Myxococcota bacterium]
AARSCSAGARPMAEVTGVGEATMKTAGHVIGLGTTFGLYVADGPAATTAHEIPLAKLVVPLDGAPVAMEGLAMASRRGPVWIAPRVRHALALPGASVTVLLDPRELPAEVAEGLGRAAVVGVDSRRREAVEAFARTLHDDPGVPGVIDEVRARFGDRPSPRLDRRIEAVLDHLGRRPEASLDELATVAGVSRSHLSRRFRAVTGLTIRRHLQWQRLLVALRRAAQGESLADAAFGAGFSDQAHFTRVARARVGRSPGELMRGNQVQDLPDAAA